MYMYKYPSNDFGRPWREVDQTCQQTCLVARLAISRIYFHLEIEVKSFCLMNVRFNLSQIFSSFNAQFHDKFPFNSTLSD